MAYDSDEGLFHLTPPPLGCEKTTNRSQRIGSRLGAIQCINLRAGPLSVDACIVSGSTRREIGQIAMRCAANLAGPMDFSAIETIALASLFNSI